MKCFSKQWAGRIIQNMSCDKAPLLEGYIVGNATILAPHVYGLAIHLLGQGPNYQKIPASSYRFSYCRNLGLPGYAHLIARIELG